MVMSSNKIIKQKVKLLFLALFFTLGISCSSEEDDKTTTAAATEETEGEVTTAEDTVRLRTTVPAIDATSLAGGLRLSGEEASYFVYGLIPCNAGQEKIKGTITSTGLKWQVEINKIPKDKIKECGIGVVIVDASSGATVLALVWDNMGNMKKQTLLSLSQDQDVSETVTADELAAAEAQPALLPSDEVIDAEGDVEIEIDTADEMVDGQLTATPDTAIIDTVQATAFDRGDSFSDELSAWFTKSEQEGLQVVMFSQCDELRDFCFANVVENAKGAADVLAQREQDLMKALGDLFSDIFSGSSLNLAASQNYQDYNKGPEVGYSESYDPSAHQEHMSHAMGSGFGDRFGGGINPRKCAEAKYNIADSLYSEFYDYSADEEYLHQGPQLKWSKQADGSFKLAVIEKNSDGSQSIENYVANRKGNGDSFTLTASKMLSELEIKERAAAEYLREILDGQNASFIPPSSPTWTDFSCDPIRLAGKILNSAGRDRFEGGLESIFSNFSWDEGNNPANGGQDPVAYCSAEAEDEEEVDRSLEEFCYEEDDGDSKKLKDFTTLVFDGDLSRRMLTMLRLQLALYVLLLI